jgi:hypothetical protein
MPLTLDAQNGFTWVRGTYTPTTTTGEARSVFLGPSMTSELVNGHAVGVDAPFDSPVYVRAYADPSQVRLLFSDTLAERARLLVNVGYIGFIQVELLGDPVPPQVMGGDIARLEPYSAGAAGRHVAVAFMAPENATALVPRHDPPFFAYNARLFIARNAFAARNDFARSGSPTGALWLPARHGDAPDPSNGPSMLAQVNVPLVTEADVDAMVKHLDPVFEEPVDRGDTAMHLYQLVIDRIKANAAKPDTWLRPEVEGRIGLENISRIRMAGRYMLLNVANSEHMQPVLAAELKKAQDDSPRLAVYLLDYDHLRGAEQLATQRFVNKGQEAWGGMAVNLPKKRGASGLDRPLVPLSDQHVVLRVRLSGVLYGESAGVSSFPWGLSPLTGFSVELVWNYDASTRIMMLNRDIAKPSPITGFEKEYELALMAYKDQRERSILIENPPTEKKEITEKKESMVDEDTQSTVAESTQGMPDEDMLETAVERPRSTGGADTPGTADASAFGLVASKWAAPRADARPKPWPDWEDADA